LDLYTLVTEHMMHGRVEQTFQAVHVLLREEDGKFVEKNRVRLDNGFIVPYNSYLLKKCQAHINVEWCNQAGSINYLFKYINKGPHTAKIQVGDRDNKAPSNVEVVDEIKVERLPFHLLGQQQMVYDEEDDIDDVLNKPSVASTKFLAWMDINITPDLAKTLTYAKFPTKFVWIAQKRIWQERKRGYAVGRIHNVPRSVGDAYYLRILLNKEEVGSGYRTLRDILCVFNIPFGGKLTKNMRLKNGPGSSNNDDIKEVADWILKVGDGRLGGPNDGEAIIDIPEHILIKDCDDLVAPTHKVVEFINDHLLSLLLGKENVYLSSNTICKSKGLNDNINESVYSPDVLNGMKLVGLPNHRLVLKVGAPVMLLRNIDQSEGLCNGTRLRIKELGDHAIKAEILTEIKVGETVSLFRFKLTPSDKRLPLQINRR
nr:hypothetical protein [Tanacetum cinerariifolium]